MAVKAFAAQGNEKCTGRKGTRVGGDRVDDALERRTRADGRLQYGSDQAQGQHGAHASRACATAAVSENGRRCPATS